jgi:hypothetical protein
VTLDDIFETLMNEKDYRLAFATRSQEPKFVALLG